MLVGDAHSNIISITIWWNLVLFYITLMIQCKKFWPLRLKRHRIHSIIHGVEYMQHSCKEKEPIERVVSKQSWCIEVYLRNLFITPICQWLGTTFYNMALGWLAEHSWINLLSSSTLVIILVGVHKVNTHTMFALWLK